MAGLLRAVVMRPQLARLCSQVAAPATAAAAGAAARKSGKAAHPGHARGPAVLVRKQKKKKSSRQEPEYRSLVSAHLLGSVHGPQELSSILRARFGAAAVRELVKDDGSSDDAWQLVGSVEDVVYLSAPALGPDSPHGTPVATIFFFTGHGSAADEHAESRDKGAARSVSSGVGASSAGGIASIGSGGGARVCVTVSWGAAPEFVETLLSDLRAAKSTHFISRQHSLDRLAVQKETTSFHLGSGSKLQVGGDEITIDGSAPMAVRLLDQLAFSHALMRHMKLQLVEDEAERIVDAMKQTGLGASLLKRLLPTAFGGSDFGASTMQRLLLLREFNFDADLMSTPDWLWEQSQREEIYDSMVAEYEIEERIEAVNQQLDYAQGTMQSLKEDKHHSHSLFLEYTICFLIAFEILVEVHALGWLDFSSAKTPPPPAVDDPLLRRPSKGGRHGHKGRDLALAPASGRVPSTLSENNGGPTG